jgi:hypothetical protein
VARAIAQVGGRDPDVTTMPVIFNAPHTGYVELPLFRVRTPNGEDRFVDNVGRIYDDFEHWRATNQLPPGRVSYPRDGHLSVGDDGRTAYVTEDTHAVIDTPEEEIANVLDSAALVGGFVVGAAGVFVSGGTLLPAAMTAVGAWSAGRSVSRVVDGLQHGQRLTDPALRADVIAAGADSLTLLSLGLTGAAARAERLFLPIAGDVRALANTASMLSQGADAVAITTQGIDLAANWERYSPEARLLAISQMAFWTGSLRQQSARYSVDNVQAVLHTATSPAVSRAQFHAAYPQADALTRLTPEQFKAAFGTGPYAEGLAILARRDGFIDLAIDDPATAGLLYDSWAQGYDVASRIDADGLDATIEAMRELAPAVTQRGPYTIYESPPNSPLWQAGAVFQPDRTLDHNGAFHESVFELTPDGRRLVPSAQRQWADLRTHLFDADGNPIVDLRHAAVFRAHGSRSGFQGLTTRQAAAMVADELVRMNGNRPANQQLEYLVLSACSQGDRRWVLFGESNAQQFQRFLNDELRARGLGQIGEVTVLAAEHSGQLYADLYGVERYAGSGEEVRFVPADQQQLDRIAGIAGGGLLVLRLVEDDEPESR